MAALRLCRLGVRDVLLLDRERFPRDKPCASGLGPNALKILDAEGLGDEVRRRSYSVQGLRLVTPGKREMLLPSEGAATVMVRREFDALLAGHAQRAGATFRDGTPVTGLLREGGRVVGVRAGNEELRAEVVVVANGANSSLFGARPRQLISSVMGWWEDFPIESGMMEMVFDRRIAPLYAWVFPESDTRVNIGLCMDPVAPDGTRRPSVRQVFQELVEEYWGARLRKARQVGTLKGHPIPHTLWPQGCTEPGALALGDAARVANSATGEGIFQAMQSALFAAEAVRDVLDGRPEAQVWRRYQWRLRQRFGPPSAVAQAVRGVLRTPALDVVARLHGSELVRRTAGPLIALALSGARVKQVDPPRRAPRADA